MNPDCEPEQDDQDPPLSLHERALLLRLAREALEQAICAGALLPLDLTHLPPPLQALGASFVTLTRCGELRGCIGALEPFRPLAEDVRQHTLAAALQDFRFPPVTPEELPEIQLEISRLTQPRPLEYSCPEELLSRLRPGVDGVVIRDGPFRATFLPQVWEKLPDSKRFLRHLCVKMGAPPDLWKIKKLEILTYQVEEFGDPDPS